MGTPLVIEINNMKTDIAEAVNKYINSLPAEIISDMLDKISTELKLIAQQQLAMAKESLEKPEEDKTE
jgi:ubiquinone biosynthesis protein UbiJ